MIRIIVVEDHEVVRAGLCRLLGAEPDLEVVADTGLGHEAIRLRALHSPDVVVLDYGLPDLDGIEVTRQLVEQSKRSRILILTMHSNEEYATRVIRAGAAGFVAKVAPAEELLQAVRKVAAGGIYITPTVLERMVVRLGQPAPDVPEAALSDRELQVLVRLARGMTTREVADGLHLSVSTIETYRSRIMEKLNLRNNSDMTRFAVRRGLVGLE